MRGGVGRRRRRGHFSLLLLVVVLLRGLEDAVRRKKKERKRSQYDVIVARSQSDMTRRFLMPFPKGPKNRDEIFFFISFRVLTVHI